MQRTRFQHAGPVGEEHEEQPLSRKLRLELRRSLPARAFEARPRTLLYVGAQWAQLWLIYWLIDRTTSPWALGVLALWAGHALFCLGIAAHAISHGTVVRNRSRYLLELLTWTPTFVSTTAWIYLHNRVHHRHVNTTRDIYLYRYFTPRERRFGAKLYTLLFYPNRYLPWNPLVLMPPLMFTLFPVFHALLKIEMPASPELQSNYEFTSKERARVALEFSLMVGYQLLLGQVFGAEKWLYAGLIPAFVGMGIGMAYINTQHHLRPFAQTNDPIGGSTTLALPAWVNWLHINFGYHIEHHVYPSMDSYYYPQVSKVLKAQLGDNYHQIGFFEAYRRMFESELFKEPRSIRDRSVAADAMASPQRSAEPARVTPGELP